jgi:3-dehydroquinate synthase
MSKIFLQANEFNDFLHAQELIIVCDANTNGFCAPIARAKIPALQKAYAISVPAGESCKTWDVLEFLLTEWMKCGVNKRHTIVIIGGGALSDLVGLAASIYMRGLPIIIIPTTLLSMTDAAHGGKNGINFNGIKNSVGAFAHAKAIYIDHLFLDTLAHEYIIEGCVESIKHSLITTSALWQIIEEKKTPENFCSELAIQESYSIKNKFVEEDPYDEGIRQALNFGHTIGHALEACTDYLHGEAIFWGMIAELIISEEKFKLSSHIRAQLIAYNEAYMHIPLKKVTIDLLLEKMMMDKKNTQEILFSLLQDKFVPEIKVPITIDQISQALHLLYETYRSKIN